MLVYLILKEYQLNTIYLPRYLLTLVMICCIVTIDNILVWFLIFPTVQENDISRKTKKRVRVIIEYTVYNILLMKNVDGISKGQDNIVE